MRLSTLLFLLDEAGKNIRRNGLMTVAALSTVTVSLAVLGGAGYALYRVHQFAEAQARGFEMAVFFHVETPRDQAERVVQRIRQIPEVRSAVLYPKERALAEWTEEDREARGEITAALEGANPLPDRVDVMLKDPSLTAAIAQALRDPRRFPEIAKVNDERETLGRLLATSRLIRNIALVVGGLLFIATALVIQNTIRMSVHARRREIRIMQLVGATAGFIRLPLVMEALFHGLIGALIASCLVLFVVAQISAFASRYQSPLAAATPPAVDAYVVVSAMVAAGLLIGLVSGSLSVRRYLKRV